MNIYKILDPFTLKVMYVGKTEKELYVRLLQHFHETFYRKRRFPLKQQWFDRLAKNFILPKIELIEQCSILESNAREKYWIEKLKPLFNIMMNNNIKHIEFISNMRSIIIYQYDIGGNFIKEWKSITEAAKTLNIENGNICAAANHKRKLAGIWQWSYVKEEKLHPYKKEIFSKKVHKYDINGNYIKSYNNAKETGVKNKLISKCCNGDLKTVYGFRYSFEKVNKLPELKRKIRKDKIKI